MSSPISPSSFIQPVLIFPRSREIYCDQFDESHTSEKAVTNLLAEDVRSAIRRESYGKVAEKSKFWNDLARERNEELLVCIESEARADALRRQQTDDLVNAQYRLQRQRREEVEAAELRLREKALTRIASNNVLLESPSASKPVEEKSSVSSGSSEKAQDAVVAYLDELRKNLQVLTPLINALPSLELPTTDDVSREIHQRYMRVSQKASSLAATLASEAAGDADVAGVGNCVAETKALTVLTQEELKKIAENQEKQKQAEQLAVESELEVLEETRDVPESMPNTDTQQITLSPGDRAHQIYETYSQKARSARNAFTRLESDPSLKALKSAVLFASSNPVVICSANSPMEIIEPYRKAFLLLRGCEVETNSIKIRLSDHPDIVHYVRYNMAKKFIDLACMQTEEKNEIKLFALATLMTELWSCDHEFGEIFLALLFSEYPVVIPYYDKGSLKLEGNVDLQLKRLSALSKFYAAIMQTDRSFLLRRLFPTKTFDGRNPHGIQAAWELLANLVNQDVQLGTTVLILRSVLSVAGWLLKKTYDKQFTKLMAYVTHEVLPKIRGKTPKELQGPIERLSDLLDVFHRTQTVAVPENRLSDDFWRS